MSLSINSLLTNSSFSPEDTAEQPPFLAAAHFFKMRGDGRLIDKNVPVNG